MKGCLKWVAILGGIFIVVSIIIVIAAGGDTTPQTGRPAVSTGNVAPVVVADEPDATPTPDWMAPPFEGMCDTNDTMTDLQQEDYAASMADKKVVQWTGQVYDVQAGEGGLYDVQVDMRGGIFNSRQVEIHGVPRDIAAGLNVEQEITFDGTIREVAMFMDDICNPIHVVEATITAN